MNVRLASNRQTMTKFALKSWVMRQVKQKHHDEVRNRLRRRYLGYFWLFHISLTTVLAR